MPEVRPWKPCFNCNGFGILIGPLDEQTQERLIRECPKCDGLGIKIDRALEKTLVAIDRRATHAATHP